MFLKNVRVSVVEKRKKDDQNKLAQNVFPKIVIGACTAKDFDVNKP